MKNYELSYLVSLDLSEEQATSLQEKIVSFITTKEGVLINLISPVKKLLAYPIEKQANAYLATVNFQLSSENLKELEASLKEEKSILRYLILIKKPARKIKMSKIADQPVVEKIKKEPKVELKEIEKKLDEILKVDEE